MSGLLGVLVSYAALAGGAASASDIAMASDDLCALGGPACEAEGPLAENDSADGPVDYATPAEINCPATDRARGLVSHPELPVAVGACSPPSLDFHYRVSRVPESERPNGALRPQRTRRNTRPVASLTSLPLEHGPPLSFISLQPIAMYAVFSLLPPSGANAGFEAFPRAAARTLEPLDRPPRA